MIDETQKPIYQRWWFILFLVFLGIGIILYSVIHTEKTETDSIDVADTIFYKKMEKEELKEKMMQSHMNPEVIAAEIIMKNFGTTYIEKENAVVSSRFESGILETIALEERIISTKTTRHSFLYNTVEFMKVMKSQEEVTQATLIVQAPLTDRYGNVENGDVMIVLMSRETLNKINFNNFKADNLSAVADSYWEHPALSAE
ncbi:hypothetical protein [Psychrobacillus psychrodurans]|uniref:hypothetical protein n=1 Tax=Psychrobacillus psychrodurans TaxID=126157 RepID=UPI0008ECEE5B|nr:hypothetical protein [Psychrobacillus psychrodurans]MCZ8539701.1 hypothetical protein [Psychrobacillus psychrodurans]SFM94143.1 hypothetical protein SAMN05421832_109146 [Psychrobacillus psychrodurans]